MAVLGLRFCARASSSCGKRGPLFITVRGPLTIVASLVEHRLQTRRLSSCVSRAQLLRGMWDLPRPGLEPMSPALAGRLSTTAPPGKSPQLSFLILVIWVFTLFFLSQLHSLYFSPHSRTPRASGALPQHWRHSPFGVFTKKLSFFSLVNLAKGLSILLTFGFVDFLYCFSILFTSVLIFIIFFLLLALSLVCSSFPTSLRCKVRLLIWDPSSLPPADTLSFLI